MRRLASIDIGSNTILMLIAVTTRDKRVIPLLEISRMPRLAEGQGQTGIIAAASLKRAVNELNYLKRLAGSYGADEIYVVATQAIRAAENREEVLRAIEHETGLRPEVIDGEKEAELTYRGAVTGMIALKPNRILVDIGGASSEIVMARAGKIKRLLSLEIGAVALTEKYRTDLAKSGKVLDEIRQELDDCLKGQLEGIKASNEEMLGSGGTVSTLKMLDMHFASGDPHNVHGKKLRGTHLDDLLVWLAGMKLSERRRVISFEPRRAEVIVAGGLILQSLMNHFGKKSVRVSMRSLRWGFLLSKL